MDSFCIKPKAGRETENRGRKALHATPKKMAERIQLTEGGYGAREFLLAEQGRDVPPGRPGKSLRSVPLRVCAKRLGKRRQETVLPS